jgi:hypothetical protein
MVGQGGENDRSGGICTLRAVVESTDDLSRGLEVINEAGSFRRGSNQTTISEASSTHAEPLSVVNEVTEPPNFQVQPLFQVKESWQAHLSHDLSLPRHSKRHIIRNARLSQSEIRLPSYETPSSTTTGFQRRNSRTNKLSRNWFSRSSPMLVSNEHQYPQNVSDAGEGRRRLLSSSRGPSMPMTASLTSSGTRVGDEGVSGSGSTSGNWKEQRLASMISPSEFEVDEGFSNAWIEAEQKSEDHEVEATSIHPGTPNGPVETVIKRKLSVGDESDERPRNPTPLSAPNFRFKPKPDSSNSKLTQHPLSTPIQHNMTRIILPTRNSSLASSPNNSPSAEQNTPSFAFTFRSDLSLPQTQGMSPAQARTTPCFIEERFSPQLWNIHDQTPSVPENEGDISLGTACVWTRYQCIDGYGKCFKEKVERCICPDSRKSGGARDMGTEASVGVEGGGDGYENGNGNGNVDWNRCRSTAPQVRYVDQSCAQRCTGA